MPLINCKTELELRWNTYCALVAGGCENDEADSINNICTVKDTKLYIPVVTLSAKYNKKLSNFLSKRFILE